jgi:glycine/serine hydroxymethyltransferase
MCSILTQVSLLQNKDLYAPLAQIDPEIQNIIDKETWRQFSGLELIASEVGLLVYRIISSTS